jgi:cell division septation protein DedD
MSPAQQDTEITLGTGRMLVIFFALVLVCAFFFSIGFSLGRRTANAVGASLLSAPSAAPATVVRPSAVKDGSSAPAAQSGDFSFYKAVGAKNADSALTPQDAKAQTATPSLSPTNSEASPKTTTDAASAAPAAPTSGSYYVQVAAVSHQEDADSLVEALKKKQYPAVAANNASVDKFYHVEVGPYTDLKEAEAMKARLIADGYNPIVKK